MLQVAVRGVTHGLVLPHAKLTTRILQFNPGEHREVVSTTTVEVATLQVLLFPDLEELGNEYLARAQRHEVGRLRNPLFSLHNVLPFAEDLWRVRQGDAGEVRSAQQVVL